VTALAVVLGALVALVAPPAFWPALDLVAGWSMLLGSAMLIVLVVDDATPTLARATGRVAFRVARAAYKIARK
jgi:hypothetical protein